MELKKNIEDSLNKQLNLEYFSSYLYLSMSAYFASENLEGFSHWMKIQSQEELKHAMKLFDFLANRNAKISLAEIKKPENEWNSPLNAFESALVHEQKVSLSIHELFELSRKEKDFASESLMQWYVNEQIEEENTARKLTEKLKLIGTAKSGLLMLDRELASRK